MPNVQAVYGITDLPDLNANLMEKVLEHSSYLGNTPQIIGSDFNAPLGDLWKVSQSLAMALISRRLVDLNCEVAEAGARPCLCHFQGPGEYTAIENRWMLGLRPDCLPCKAGRAVAGLQLPRTLSRGMPQASQRVYRVVRPPKLTLLARDADEQHALVQALLVPYKDWWAQLLAFGNVDDAWAF